MLISLHIENIAVVKRLDVDFSKGLTVLTGETGAGKSIIIDSIGLLLGGRPSRALIRSGESSAEVSAMFCAARTENTSALAELGIEPDDDGIIYVKRTITDDGRAQTKINGRSVPVSLQREVCGLLLNIHGQHENQKLLENSRHLGFLDKYAGDETELADFLLSYKKSEAIRREIEDLTLDDKDREREISMLKFQLDDIDSAKLKAGEEEELLSKQSRIQNIEKIEKHANIIYRSLFRAEKGSSAVDLILTAVSAVTALSDVMENADSTVEKLTNFRYELEEIAERANELVSEDLGEDPSTALDKIEARLDIIYRLRKKYGEDIGQILRFREGVAQRLDNIELSELRISELNAELSKAQEVMRQKAAALTEKRTDAARRLSAAVMGELAFLDMEKVRFCVEVQPAEEIGSKGGDNVDFLISTNPGEPLMPLEKTASGGELSRIMLALKNVLAECEDTETLIFDEVDTGISGRTSHKIGLKLKQTASVAQVLCVTHSPQIAALADTHLFISKSDHDGRTETSLRELDRDGRIGELARIMGGEKISDTLLKTAEEMLGEHIQ